MIVRRNIEGQKAMVAIRSDYEILSDNKLSSLGWFSNRLTR